MSNTLRKCPVCLSPGPHLILHTQEYLLREDCILPQSNNIVACKDCGLVYADTEASQQDYDQFYREQSKYEASYVNKDNSLFTDRARQISLFATDKDASILDIGCGDGQLLEELQKLGFSNLTALDPSQACISSIQARGMSGIQGSIFEAPVNVSFDCTILSGVLEHICDVREAMSVLKRLTTPNGLLFVIVPDSSRYVDFDSVPFDYFNVEHINHFDEHSLLQLGLLSCWETVGLVKSEITFYREKQPILFWVYRNSFRRHYTPASYSRERVEEYVSATGKNQRVKMLIDELATSQREVIVWGAGNYTSRLLKTTSLPNCNIVMLVDSDPNKQGTFLAGNRIGSPSDVLSHQHPLIAVAAAVFHEEIATQIAAMDIQNEVIMLK